jgi:2-dehydropantoate 2-reductase
MNNIQPLRILIFGAGVIGSAFAVRLSQSGIDVTLLDRGDRLTQLQSKSLLYADKGVTKALSVNVIEQLADDDLYDFILVPVPLDRMKSALLALRDNRSKNIVTLGNGVDYDAWCSIVGERLLPGFPGAGGDIKDGVLYAKFEPRILGGTTFGEIDGDITDRVKRLAALFESAGIPKRIPEKILYFHMSHAAIVMSVVHFYSDTGIIDLSTARGTETLRKVAADIKLYTGVLKRAGIPLADRKAKALAAIPEWLIVLVFKLMFNFDFTARVLLLGSHAKKAREEILLLQEGFHTVIDKITSEKDPPHGY